MIETDGRPTIASRRADPLLREALEKGGHLGDEVARVILKAKSAGKDMVNRVLIETLTSDDEALD